MDNEDMYGFLSYGDKDTFVSPLHPVSSSDEVIRHYDEESWRLAILILRPRTPLSAIPQDIRFCRWIPDSGWWIFPKLLWSFQYVPPNHTKPKTKG